MQQDIEWYFWNAALKMLSDKNNFAASLAFQSERDDDILWPQVTHFNNISSIGIQR